MEAATISKETSIVPIMMMPAVMLFSRWSVSEVMTTWFGAISTNISAALVSTVMTAPGWASTSASASMMAHVSRWLSHGR